MENLLSAYTDVLMPANAGIRDAFPADAGAVCAVVRASIIELCATDHGSKPEILAQWLANKTPANVRRWTENPEGALLEALETRARLWGVAACTLTSTQTAHRFYLTAGYCATGPPVEIHGVTGIPMAKSLEKEPMPP